MGPTTDSTASETFERSADRSLLEVQLQAETLLQSDAL